MLSDGPGWRLHMGFPTETLALLHAAQEVQIETRAATGATHRVPIWVIVDASTVFARSYNGADARWYRELTARPGVVVIGERHIPVRAIASADPDSVRRTSEGYQKKYAGSRSLRAMQRPDILGTTIELQPAD
jgi:hypothetical protein